MSFSRLFFSLLSLSFFFVLIGCGPKSRPGDPKVLVFSKTAGFRHGSIEAGQEALRTMGEEKGFEVEVSEDADIFTDENLKQYAAVVFLNTTGDILNTDQEIAFERYIQAGGGFVGIHAAADTEYDWKWYGNLNGAYFKSHPHIQEAELKIHTDPNFPLLDTFPDPWVRTDEWYNFRKVPEHVNVLISIDESTYEGGENGENHPMVWYHEYDGGRAFYMGLGHSSESFEENLFLELLYAGLNYAMGANLELDYAKAKSEYPPDANRFDKVEFVRGLDEPTEMTILPDLSILVTERKGGLKHYDQKTGKLREVAHFDVYHHTDVEGVNVEMGFMGIQADPDFDKNNWVYVFYSPLEPSVDRLSRFKFVDGEWDMDSEQVILDVETDRDICCHTAGSIAFDASGNLYLSTGDNSTPFNEKDPETGKTLAKNLYGYAPLDDREGFYNYDARRSSGNTNDLRGKILRIKMNEDGTYEIPEGNLFDKDNPLARPEIYVMGNRNPYRISIDQKNGYLYWGEVGPDARNDSLQTRGPKGYDEINQAREAGNFGWPYFVGDNFAYWEYDFDTGESLFPYDPDQPVNLSRHNTGMKELPPAQPAFIYYPYEVSEVFPSLGSGGRNSMTGPVYYPEFYPEENRLPEYFTGKLFIYDWIRNWIKVVNMDENGDLLRIDPFMPDQKFYNIIDMEMGPDGKLYILEYGTGWFTKNENSSLSVIEYNPGNRVPEADLAIAQKAGSLPFVLDLDASQSFDPDDDKLSYSFYLNDELIEQTDQPEISYTIEEPGTYSVYVQVDDGNGGVVKSPMSTVVAGNSRPEVEIVLSGNKQFYFDQKPIRYEVRVNDKEDGSLEDGAIDRGRLMIESDYVESPDLAATTVGHQELIDPAIEVETIFAGNDCASCHKTDEESIGPSYVEVSERYKNDPDVEAYLMDKIINGGSGAWGDVAMSAHPDMNPSDVRKIVHWIQSLTEEKTEKTSHDIKGQIIPARDFSLTEDGTIILSASYTDTGAPGSQPLTGSHTVYLSRPVVSFHQADELEGGSKGSHEGQDFVLVERSAKGNLGKIDLTDVKSIDLVFVPVSEGDVAATISLKSGSADGTVIASGEIGAGGEPMKPAVITLSVDAEKQDETDDVWFTMVPEDKSVPVALISIRLN